MLAHNANMNVYFQWCRFAGALVCNHPNRTNNQALRRQNAALRCHGASQASTHILSHLIGESVAYRTVQISEWKLICAASQMILSTILVILSSFFHKHVGKLGLIGTVASLLVFLGGGIGLVSVRGRRTSCAFCVPVDAFAAVLLSSGAIVSAAVFASQEFES